MARRLGVEIAPAWMVPSLALRDHLQLLFRVHGIRSVVDVGANVGQFRNFLRNQVGFEGAILSFEPDPACVAQLRELARGDPNWSVHAVALGDSAGKAVLNRSEDSPLNSLHELAEGVQHPRSGVVDRVEVQVARLDGFRDELEAAGSPLYLKLDTQGHELQVLEGATGVLESIAAMQAELSVIPLYRDVPLYTQALPAIQAYGFEPVGFYPVNLDRKAQMIDFDCIFTKRNSGVT